MFPHRSRSLSSKYRFVGFVLRTTPIPPTPAPISPDFTTNQGRLQQIAAGRPQIYPETSEAFVAQMLNLDLLDAISFNKGCYTGQEIVARAHFRGKVKRRMQHFRTQAPSTLVSGADGKLTDGRSFKVVEAAQLADGRCEFLAVAALQGGTTDEETSSSTAVAPVTVEVVSLPYALPA